MTAEAWIAIAGLVATFILAPLAIFLWNLYQSVSTIKNNHLNHIELYLKLICDKLLIEYHEPQDRS
jgi:hypothetical protein